MRLGSKELIFSGAICGLFSGKVISEMFFGALPFIELTPRHFVLIAAFTILGGFIGHVLRHSQEYDKNDDDNLDN